MNRAANCWGITAVEAMRHGMRTFSIVVVTVAALLAYWTRDYLIAGMIAVLGPISFAVVRWKNMGEKADRR